MRKMYVLGWGIVISVVLTMTAGCAKGSNTSVSAGGTDAAGVVSAYGQTGETSEAPAEPEGETAPEDDAYGNDGNASGKTVDNPSATGGGNGGTEDMTTDKAEGDVTGVQGTSDSGTAASDETSSSEKTTADDLTADGSATGTPSETTAPETTAAETTKAEETTTMSEEERKEAARQKIAAELPGIVCWGDSLTAGYGGNGESYPAVLERLIEERLTDGIVVVNNGVCVESTQTIMARAGAFPMYAYSFEIPAECTPVHLQIVLEGGYYTNLTSFGDAGLNPVTIAGVKGNLTPVYVEGEYGHVNFCRLEEGEAVQVDAMTPVYSAGAQMYQGYINVYFMGENGFYSSPEDLISQYERLIEARGTDRYVIIGLTTGDNSSRGELSAKMAAAFGDNYIDMRTELCSRGAELAGLERKEGDWYNIQEGIVMGYLMSDDIHLNEYGYRAVGEILYERMEQLGYFDGIKNIIAEYR